MKKILCIVLSVFVITFSCPLIAFAEVTYDTAEQAVAYVRDALTRRQEEITVKVNVPYTDKLSSDIMDAAMSEDVAVDSSQGDYIRYSYAGWESECEYSSTQVKINYTVEYYTTYAKEAVVNEYVCNLIDGIDGSDYEIVKYFYDTMASTIKYDFSDNIISHSAYAAVNGKAVCQGYALLFYKLCKEWGIDCRIVGGDNHCWNIVKMDGKWYNADVCWDAVLWNQKNYGMYFLKGNSDFEGHTLDDKSIDIESQFTMANTAYDVKIAKTTTEPVTELETSISKATATESTMSEKRQEKPSEATTAVSATTTIPQTVKELLLVVGADADTVKSNRLVIVGFVSVGALCLLCVIKRRTMHNADFS